MRPMLIRGARVYSVTIGQKTTFKRILIGALADDGAKNR